jgi:hypothetical protein
LQNGDRLDARIKRAGWRADGWRRVQFLVSEPACE